jgi:hypothetical protein
VSGQREPTIEVLHVHRGRAKETGRCHHRATRDQYRQCEKAATIMPDKKTAL